MHACVNNADNAQHVMLYGFPCLAQALMLDGIVSDTGALIKQTGIFYDRYSATHRDNTADVAAYSSSLRNVDPAPGAKDSHGAPVESGRRDIGEHRLGINTKPNAVDKVSATATDWAKRVEVARQEEKTRNFLDRTVEAGAAGGGAGAKELQELDRQCYSLLESNAQLCLRLQGLGLDYTGLARRLAAEEKEVKCSCRRLRLGRQYI